LNFVNRFSKDIQIQVYKDRDSSVGIAILYWLGGPGIESRWGEI
jgi:hypothetical protein